MVAGHLQEKKGYYHIVLSYKDESGKHKTKWTSTGLPVKGNKKKAEFLLLEARTSFVPPKIATDEEVTFTDYMESWLEMVRPNIELTTYASYAINIKAVICPYFSDRKLLLQDIQPKHIQDFYSHCMTVRGVSANSVIHYHANIRKALKYAVDTDLLLANPADKVQRPRVPKFVGKFYDIDEVNELFGFVRGTRIELPVLLAAFYGLRRSEILGLKWDAIDFKSNTITIRHTVTAAVIDGKQTFVVKDRTKNKSSYRSLPLVAEFHEILSNLYAQQAENRELCKSCYNKEYLGYICVDEMGNRIKPDYITNRFTLTLKNNNLRRIRFHDLRHTAASLLLAAGISMKEIQEWLGHSDFGTTANIYGHLDVNSKLRSADAMRAIGMNLVAQT